MHKVFIDGQAGTTGLEIHQRLAGRDHLELLIPDSNQRKVLASRLELARAADVSILCLPDDSARELVDCLPRDARVLDASTAFRVAKNWVYGLPEMTSGQRKSIQNATRVSNPGCYPTGVVLMLRPLFEAGLLAANTPVTVVAQSGYSGGGRGLIELYEAQGDLEAYPGARPYALTQPHKHIPEMELYSGIHANIIFLPSVGAYRRGMLVQIPVPTQHLKKSVTPNDILKCWQERYPDELLIQVQAENSLSTDNGYLNPAGLANTDLLELGLFSSHNQLLLTARLDNLGKGAAGVAVQNLNLMLGVPELTGLVMN